MLFLTNILLPEAIASFPFGNVQTLDLPDHSFLPQLFAFSLTAWPQILAASGARGPQLAASPVSSPVSFP